jgi:hypothetical protein
VFSQVAAMKGPGFGVYRQDYYTDIAIATGATFIAKEVRDCSLLFIRLRTLCTRLPLSKLLVGRGWTPSL